LTFPACSPGFNTQPPEGGWLYRLTFPVCSPGFNTQPPEGGWDHYAENCHRYAEFQHAAARRRLGTVQDADQYHARFQHAAARRRLGPAYGGGFVERRFQHAAARRRLGRFLSTVRWFPVRFNTQPPEGGWLTDPPLTFRTVTFQHAAARRRLEPLSKALLHQVSQP